MSDSKVFKAAAVGAGAGIAFGITSFLFLTRFHQGMGSVLFLLTPIAAGFCIAIIARGAETAAAAALLSVLFTLVVLVATGKEGVLCALLAFPVIFAGLGIGIGIGVLARRILLRENQPTTMGMLLLLGPALIVTGDRIERPLLEHPRIEVVQTSIEVNDPPESVWSHILTVDNVQASKPLLMYVGLPIPQRCVLSRQGLGAKRTCYFNAGFIEETITAWNPPYYMGLSIDRTHMPGRHWLGFENAAYRLEAKDGKTLLTRTTTISSHLRPAWYWKPFERWGVESEHRYILQDVAMKAQH